MKTMVFQTLGNREHKAILPEKRETDEVSLSIASILPRESLVVSLN